MKQDKKLHKSPKFWLCIALALVLISSIGAMLVQSAGGSITIKDLRWETETGHQMSALLLVPDTATAENPAPAIVTSHGWYNNREMQDLNYVEYARRGYVVMSIDMYSHGNSDNLPGTWFTPESNGIGMYDAVKLMSTFPYVDTARIGVTGHSNGAAASRLSLRLDNEAETPLIAAALFVSNDADYYDEAENFANLYGGRDIGIVACQYDEFFHRVPQAGYEPLAYSPPREFINQVTAQSFLHFGQDPNGLETRSSYTLYHQDIDGQDAIRVIYNPNQIHPWAHFSKTVVASSVEFFEAALGAPNPIAPGSQVWQWKVFFNTIGLVGFMMFFVNIILVLIGTKPFAALKASGEVRPAPAPTGAGKAWLWGGLAVGTIFSMLSYYTFIYKFSTENMPGIFKQQPPYFIGLWSAVCGLFTLLILFLSYQTNGKKSGSDLRANGVILPKGTVWKTILLALIAAVSSYGLVFVTDYLFKTDFRIWVLTIKAFTPDKLGIILLYLPFFLIFYVINSVSINSFNYVQMGKKSWVNTVVMAVFNGLSPAILIIWIYATFVGTGYLPNESMTVGGSIIGIWLFPIVVVLPVAAVVSRIIYKATKNPYISGIGMAILVTAMSCTNTLTVG